jgi:hypothetical protein
MVWYCSSMGLLANNFFGQLLVCALTVCISMLTVLNVPYRSFKQEVDFRGRVPVFYVFAITFILMSVAINPVVMILFWSTIYALSGPFRLLQEGNLMSAFTKQSGIATASKESTSKRQGQADSGQQTASAKQTSTQRKVERSKASSGKGAAKDQSGSSGSGSGSASGTTKSGPTGNGLEDKNNTDHMNAN